MKISQQLKEKNIAEYLIYMWQVEDLIRANKCDIDFIRNNIISRYPAEERAASGKRLLGARLCDFRCRTDG